MQQHPMPLLGALLLSLAMFFACGTSDPPAPEPATSADDEMVDPVRPIRKASKPKPSDAPEEVTPPKRDEGEPNKADDEPEDSAPERDEVADKDPTIAPETDPGGQTGEPDDAVDPPPTEKLPPLPFEESDGTDDLEILEATMASNVKNRMPIGRGDTFRPGKLWAWIRARNVGKEATKLTTVWRYEGREMHQSELNIGVSKGWRTWSYHTITSGQIGRWSVELLDSTGARIQMLPFTVVSAKDAPGKEPPGKLP